MGKSILPSGEEIGTTPEEILRYLNPDGIRQMLRQERLRWNLKPNTDTDFYDNQLLYKYTGELHNRGIYQRMEIRTFPDNNAYHGYAGITNDSGVFGLPHNIEEWDKSMSSDSISTVVNRTYIGANATIPEKEGYGLSNDHNMVTKTDNRMAGMVFDPYDGRAYLYSNDDPNYVNNETRQIKDRLPERTVARIGDIPTRITQLMNDLDFVSDPDYRHTDNNFTNSNRYMLDNLDDRTFVYPEISRDKNGGDFITNKRIGLKGEPSYGECDGNDQYNKQPDLGVDLELGRKGDRLGEPINSYGANQDFCGVKHEAGYLPGIFRSLDELNRVDLVNQTMTPMIHNETPGAKRHIFYYSFDGKWSPNWFDRYTYNDSYLAQPLNPVNMEIVIENSEPVPFAKLNTTNQPFQRGQLYQWRYNRVSIKYYSENIKINIVESGLQYEIGDKLRWSFGDDVFIYIVKTVGSNGQIQSGEYIIEKERVFEQDPSTHGVGLPFSNMSGVGHGALLSVSCKATIECNATQIKNNLYAYVDITPSVRSDNESLWSDVNTPDTQGGIINIRSTAAGPAYSGINSGRGGPIPNPNTSSVAFYEHGGNATAGVHVHLFRYVINTQNPTWVIKDGIQVFTGEWVDQGPMGVERPCDIKALLFSNYDTNNFNNYYKFTLDSMLDNIARNPDGVETNNPNALSQLYIHKDQRDPRPDQKFTDYRVDPESSVCKEIDVTNQVLYINVATGVSFVYNEGYKNDPNFGYGNKAPGWVPLAGVVTR